MQHAQRIFAVVVFALLGACVLPGAALADADTSSSIEQTFQKAKQEYLQKNLDAAAKHLKKGAAYMKAQADKATAKGKEGLATSAKELDQLAEDMKKGAVTSEKKMEDTFARAYLALAANDHVQSTESWAKKQSAKTGAALESAGKNLEKSFAWAGQKVEKATNDVLVKSDELSQKLKKKGRVVADDVSRGLKEAGNEIEKFAKKISPDNAAK